MLLSLLNVPALLMIGFDPASTLATNKFQGTFSSLSASIHFWRKGKLHLRDYLVPCLTAFTASVLGAIVASYIKPELLRKIISALRRYARLDAAGLKKVY